MAVDVIDIVNFSDIAIVIDNVELQLNTFEILNNNYYSCFRLGMTKRTTPSAAKDLAPPLTPTAAKQLV